MRVIYPSPGKKLTRPPHASPQFSKPLPLPLLFSSQPPTISLRTRVSNGGNDLKISKRRISRRRALPSPNHQGLPPNPSRFSRLQPLPLFSRLQHLRLEIPSSVSSNQILTQLKTIHLLLILWIVWFSGLVLVALSKSPAFYFNLLRSKGIDADL